MNSDKYIYYDEEMAIEKIGFRTRLLLSKIANDFSDICILCIGSDRATGDSLGPIAGQRLRELIKNDTVKIYGDLKETVHAANIQSVLEKIHAEKSNSFIIAIDAALSKFPAHVGRVNIGKGSLRPGTSVGKKLPAVGHIYITGVVNWTSGLEGLAVLQSTRLGNVFEMAEVIAKGVAYALCKTCPCKHSNLSI